MNKISQHGLAKQIFLLVVLYFIIDILFTFIHPSINLLRATFVSLVVLVILLAHDIRNWTEIRPIYGFLSVYLAAIFRILFVESEVFSPTGLFATMTRIGIIAASYILLVTLYDKKGK